MIRVLFTWHFHFFCIHVSLDYILNWGYNLRQWRCWKLIQILPLSRWELCNSSGVSHLSAVTTRLPDASSCFETYFLKLRCVSENITFLSFLYVLLSCPYFCFTFFPPGFSPLPSVKPSLGSLLLPLALLCPPLFLSFSLCLPGCVFLNSWSKLMKMIWFSLSTGRVKMARHWSDRNLCHQGL